MLESYFLPNIPILGVLMNSFLFTSLADKDLDPKLHLRCFCSKYRK